MRKLLLSAICFLLACFAQAQDTLRIENFEVVVTGKKTTLKWETGKRGTFDVYKGYGGEYRIVGKVVNNISGKYTYTLLTDSGMVHFRIGLGAAVSHVQSALSPSKLPMVIQRNGNLHVYVPVGWKLEMLNANGSCFLCLDPTSSGTFFGTGGIYKYKATRIDGLTVSKTIKIE